MLGVFAGDSVAVNVLSSQVRCRQQVRLVPPRRVSRPQRSHTMLPEIVSRLSPTVRLVRRIGRKDRKAITPITRTWSPLKTKSSFKTNLSFRARLGDRGIYATSREILRYARPRAEQHRVLKRLLSRSAKVLLHSVSGSNCVGWLPRLFP